MKITIKVYDTKYTIEKKENDLNIHDTMDMIKDLITCMYGSEAVDKYWE